MTTTTTATVCILVYIPLEEAFSFRFHPPVQYFVIISWQQVRRAAVHGLAAAG